MIVEEGNTLTLRVEGLGINGEGVAKHHGFTVFVEGALPGEEVVSELELVKKSYAKGRLVSINQEAKERVNPPCSRYSDCGGCHIMHLSYEAQIFRKTESVREALRHVGGFKDAPVLPCLPAPKPFHYRNKIQLPVGVQENRNVIGFYKRGSHEIVPYDRCLIHHPSMENSVALLKELLATGLVTPYCEASKRGTLRHIIIRANEDGEQLIGLVTTGKQSRQIMQFAELITQKIPAVVGVVESINTKVHNAILGETSRPLLGRPHLFQELDGLRFKLSLESFFQINLESAKLLYDTALRFAEIDQDSRVFDAYCGTGTWSLLAARYAKHVIGVECVPQAVRDAQDNAHHNGIDNAQFVLGKVEAQVQLLHNSDIVLVNPPRKGLENSVVTALDRHGPRRLVYISCNPATLARDLKGLTNYELMKVQPIDMFPQTMHVETVVQLERKRNAMPLICKDAQSI